MNEPFALPPRLWFGVLCQGLFSDPAGRITLQGVLNQVAFVSPPGATGVPPHAALNVVLAVGFSAGVGNFSAEVDLLDIDGNVLWQRPSGHWDFELGPGEKNGAVLVEPIQYWITRPGVYHFRVRLEPTQEEYQILFEVAEKIGPAQEEQAAPPTEPPSA